jgi:hypothetical protein
MTIELTLGIVLAVALVVLVILAARQEKTDNQTVEATPQKPQAVTNLVVEAAEMVMQEAVVTTPTVEAVVAPVVEVVAEAPVVAEVAQEVVVKPKKKRKYKPRNPQNKK